MTANKATDIFHRYLADKGIKKSFPRETVLNVFLGSNKHLSLNEIYALVQKNHPRAGFTTVYRAMKIISDAGIAEKVDFGDGIIRYERTREDEHHDHLVCRLCGGVTEVFNQEIETLQDEMAEEHEFHPTDHRLVIFGHCQVCLRKGGI